MVSNRRSISKFLLVIATVAVVILYLEFNQNSLKFRNGVKNYVPISAWATEKDDLVQRTILYQQNKDMIECRGRKQKVIRNIFSRDQEEWYENRNVCDACFDFPHITLQTNYGPTPIFIYTKDQDLVISKVLRTRGSFESKKQLMLSKMIEDDPELQIIDIGANIGVYTLSFAKAGRKVLAVEALYTNLQHLCASVMEGGLQDNVYLIHNAISNENTLVNLGIDKNNMGGTFVDVNSSHIKNLKEGRAQGTYGHVYTITMDDLLDLPVMQYFQNVVIKMDIEGFEDRAIEKATRFFEKINVKGFIMEWVFHRQHPNAKKIIDFMTARNYKPYKCDMNKMPLNVSRSDQWGLDIFWLPN